MFNIWEGDQIPYREQADKLFDLPAWQLNTTNGQQIVPFLGAGVSISGRTSSAQSGATDKLPDVEAIESCCQQLGLDAKAAKSFMRMAVFLACCLQAAEKDPSNVKDDQLLDYLQNEIYPPSGSELARLFANLSTYTAFEQVVENLKSVFPAGLINATDREQIEMFKLLAKITRIADPPDPLTSITSYYENKNTRGSLWTNLRLVISGKKEVTLTHKLLAAAAKRHFNQPDTWQDYLILTTNYDCLMEDALDTAGVDYVVLTTRRSDQKVLVRFSDRIKDAAVLAQRNSGMYYPNNLSLMKPKSMVVVYKVHGCLNPTLSEKDDGVVISDNDYVDYISQMNSTHGTIPAYVNTLMQNKAFLFLGYSLNDWNVRSVFETLRKKRGEDFGGQDYSVMSYLGGYEKLFFQRNSVTILKTDLNSFVSGIMSVLEGLKQNNPQRWGQLINDILLGLSATETQTTHAKH